MTFRPILAAALLLLSSLVAAAAPTVHVAMIFDDGPDPVQTPKLLTIFAEEKVHVTFGTVARNAEAHPDLIKSVVAAGHELANHSYAHLHPAGLDDATLESEIGGAEEKIRLASGFAPKWYWPPFLEVDARVRSFATKAGITVYSSRKLAVSGDYMAEVTAEQILRNATTGIVDGTVILFHEWRPETALQMKAIITELKRQGCVFVTFSQMEQQFGWTQPASTTVAAGDNATLTVIAPGSPTIQWFRGGRTLANGTSGTLSLTGIAPSDAGIYDAMVSSGTTTTLSAPAVIGLVPAVGTRTVGSVSTRPEWQDIHHPNGATYDQFLLTGAAGTFTADPDQIARCSYLDTNDSIVQVEMSGAGAITIVLDPTTVTGPLAPTLYNQSGIEYMKGKATVILAGADATTHFTMYSVGTATNPGVTRADATYVGWADVAAAGIVSSDGGLGGIHQGNVAYSAAIGFTGIYAPTVDSVGGLVVVHGIEASGSALPYLCFGPNGAVNVKIAGTSLAQLHGNSITVGGLSKVTMGAGQDSCGRGAPAQSIETRLLEDNGTDVTPALVTGP